MNEFRWQDELAGNVRVLQIIVASLVAGCTVFLVIAIVMGQQGGLAGNAPPGNAGEPPIITYISILFGVSALAAAWIVPAVMTARTRGAILKGTWRMPQAQNASAPLSELLERCGDVGKLWMLYMTKTIIRSSILEGAAFFMLVAYMVEQSPIALIGAIVLIFLVAAGFPLRSKAIHWIEDQLQILEQERQFDG